jgi:hypothetical protein
MAEAYNHNNLWRAGAITAEEAHHSLRGHWGKPTALLDWCEENYIVHWAVAEFWNTISNGGMVFLSMFGIFWVSEYAPCRRSLMPCLLFKYLCVRPSKPR